MATIESMTSGKTYISCQLCGKYDSCANHTSICSNYKCRCSNLNEIFDKYDQQQEI